MGLDRTNLNRQRALAALRSAGQLGRAELARRLDLSVQAASNITDVLLQKSLIRETGRRAGGRGLPVVLYGLNPDGAYSLGFEVRPSALYATVLDQTGAVRIEERIALTSAALEPVMRAISAFADRAEQSLPLSQTAIGAGIVRPGPFGQTGLPMTDSELPDWDCPDLHQRLEAAVHMPVTLDNDATAGASVEHQNGDYTDDFAYLYFGTGLGLGVISRGLPLQGAFSNSGEIGSLRLAGLSGRLEQHLSRAALEQALAQSGKTAPDSQAIAALHQEGDPDLSAWVTQAALALSAAVETIENLFDPATIVLGGAMPEAVLQTLIDQCPLPDHSVAARPQRSLPRLCLGTCGPFTVSAGAATLMLNRHFHSPRPL